MTRHVTNETAQNLKGHRQHTNEPSQEAIRCRAYEKFCARKGGAGDAVTDWVDAEREVIQEQREHPHKSN
jgi:hypothetical protein